MKTLKDMGLNNWVLDRDIEYVSKEELKAEAIKWAKTMDKKYEGLTKAWLIHFFNITKQELK